MSRHVLLRLDAFSAAPSVCESRGGSRSLSPPGLAGPRSRSNSSRQFGSHTMQHVTIIGPEDPHCRACNAGAIREEKLPEAIEEWEKEGRETRKMRNEERNERREKIEERKVRRSNSEERKVQRE